MVEREGGKAVLAVVAPDDLQVARVRPAARVQCGVHPGARPDGLDEVLFPGEPVEPFHLLDGVALHRRNQSLPDHLEEVHEHLVAKEHVHRVLAARVAAHEALQRPGLVAPVVVDVETSEPFPALGHQVHEGLEDLALSAAVEGPAVVIVTVPVNETEEILETAVRGRPGALDVEEQVAVGRLGERQQTAALLRRCGQLAKGPAGRALGELRLRLAMDALQRGGLDAVERRIEGQGDPAQSRQGRDAAVFQTPALVPGGSGNQGEMVIRPSPIAAHLVPVAAGAQVHGLRIGRPRVGAVVLELPPERALERREVRHAERLQLGGAAEREVHFDRRRSLHPLQQPRIHRDLEDGVRFRGRCELGVHHLVGPVTERTRA